MNRERMNRNRTCRNRRRIYRGRGHSWSAWYARGLNIVLTLVLAVSLIASLVEPQEVQAAGSDKLPNSIALDRLLTDRSYVVDALSVGIREEKDWGGKVFTGNPHLYTIGTGRFMYEQLIDESKHNGFLAVPLYLYDAKIALEDYPLETLLYVVQNNNISLLLQQFHTMADNEAVKAIKKAYEDLGGTYPVTETLKTIRAEAASAESQEFWADYSLAELQTLEGKEGTDIYTEYKRNLGNSSLEQDARVLRILCDEETEAASKKVTDTDVKITQELLYIVKSKQSINEEVNGQNMRSAKIYDAILSDLFQTDYTSGANISLGSDLATKAAFEMYTNIAKNESGMLGFVNDVAGLSHDSTRIMIDDYLEPLMNLSKSKTENLFAAFDVMDEDNTWFDEGMSIPTQENLVFHYFPPTADERLKATKEAVEERYIIQDTTLDAIGYIEKGFNLSKATLANYQLVDNLVRENESIRGILLRTADKSNDPAYEAAATSYRMLLNISTSDTSREVLTAVIRTASQELNKYLEKQISKRTKSLARKAIISCGKDAVSRARIAKSLSSLAWIYQACDFLDDYVAGYQDVAERVYEVSYLAQIQEYALAAYEQDVALYKAETNKYKANEYAGQALEDLQFLKQIKLCQIKAGYKAMDGFQNKTLAAIIAKMIDDYHVNTLEEEYKREMDAIANMMLFPGNSTPYVVPSGRTMTIKKVSYGNNGKTTYVGVYEDGSRIAELDLAISQGIEIQGNVIVDCDFVLPTIIGSGGTLKVKDGHNVVLGYLDGVLGAGSDLHFSGTVNGAVLPVAGAGKINITVDHDMECDEYMVSAVNGDEFNVTVNGDFVVEKSMQLVNTNMIVKGNAQISIDEEDSTRFMTLVNSKLTVEKDFLYNGRGYAKYDQYHYRLDTDAQLILKGKSTFDTCDKNQFAITYANDTGDASKASGIILAGNGTAKLINNVYPDQEVPQSWGGPIIETHYSIEILTNKDTGLQNVRFDTNSIAGFEELVGTVVFPANMQITENSTVWSAILKSSGTMTFDEDLVNEGGLLIQTVTHIKGNFVSNGSTTLRKSATVDGRTSIGRSFEAISSIDSAPVVLKSEVVVNEGGELITTQDQIQDESAYTKAELAAWNNEAFALTIDGNLLVKRGGEVKASSMMVTGTMTTEGYDDETGKNSYTEAKRLHVKGYFDCKGNRQVGLGGTGVWYLTIEDGADLTGLSTSGLYTIPKVTVLDPNNTVHEIITNDNVKIRDMYADDCRVSLPNGLTYENLDINGTMTVEGPVPKFRGMTAYTGELVFEDNVDDFTMLDQTSSTSGPTPPNNRFNKIHAKKDIRIYGNFNSFEPKAETDTAAGVLKVDGTLRFEKGCEAIFDRLKVDLGNADIIVESDARALFYADEVIARSVLSYSDSLFQMSAPYTDGETRHLILNGGDYSVNNENSYIDWLTLNSDETRIVSGACERFGILEANVPQLNVSTNELDVDEFRTDTEGLLITGSFSDIYLGTISDAVRKKAKTIRFEDVYGLEKLYLGYDDDRVAGAAWDISSIEKTSDGYRSSGSLILTGLDEARRVTFGCADENDMYRYTNLYRSGSLILPYWYDGKSMDHLYTEEECYNKIDVTKTQVDGNMDLYYRGPGFKEVPDDPEEITLGEEKVVSPSKLYETKTYLFIPETDGLYGFESHSNVGPEGCIVVDDGKYNSETYVYNTDDFGQQFIGRAGVAYYLQSRIPWGDIGDYTVTVIRLGDTPDPDNPDDPDPIDPGPVNPDPVDPGLNVIPIEDIESVELVHERPYLLSIDNMDEYCTFSTGIQYMLRRGDQFIFHMKDGTSITYTYGDLPIDESSSTTALNDGTNIIDLWEESVVEADENGDPVLWQEGEDHQWYVTYSMTPWAARSDCPEYAENITCLVDVRVAGAEEAELENAKDNAFSDVNYYILGDGDGALDEYADEQKAEINKLAADAKAAIEKAESAEEAERIVQDAIAAKDRIYTVDQMDMLDSAANGAKENLSNYKNERMLAEYTPDVRKQILALIAETERQIDDVMASRDDYPDFYSFYDYYNETVWELSNDCLDQINNSFEMRKEVDVEVRLSKANFTYNGKVQKPTVTVYADGQKLPSSEYKIVWDNTGSKNVGKYCVDVTLTGKYRGTNANYYYIKKGPNTMTAKGKTVSVKYSKLKKKAQTVPVKKAFTISKPVGKVTYKVTKYDKKAKKKITVSSAGKVTVKKGLKKGKYILKVKVTAAGSKNRLKTTKNVTLTVRVK